MHTALVLSAFFISSYYFYCYGKYKGSNTEEVKQLKNVIDEVEKLRDAYKKELENLSKAVKEKIEVKVIVKDGDNVEIITL